MTQSEKSSNVEETNQARPGKLTRRRFLQTVAATTVGFVAASCAAPTTPQPAAPAAPAPTGAKPAAPAATSAGAAGAAPAAAAPTAVGAETPKRGGTLRLTIHTNASIPSLDPHIESSGGTTHIDQMIYNKLLRFSARLQPDGSYKEAYEPDLAESWDHPDANTYIFHLRKGVKWQNVPPVNGREFTAQDVVYALNRIQSPEPQFRFANMFKGVTVQATDNYTVKVMSEKPSASLLFNLANQMTLIVPKELGDTSDIKKQAVGTGPFILKDYSPDQLVRLVRNPDYFDTEHVYLDGMEIYIIPDKATRKAAFKSGQLDIAFRNFFDTKADVEEITKAVPDTIVKTVPSGNRYDIWLKWTNPSINNKLRQALLYATDWRAVAAIITEGQAKRDSYIQWWLTPWTLPQEELTQYDLNLDKAKQLIAEAGYANGITLRAPTTDNYDNAKVNMILKDQWSKIGVNLEISMMENTAWMNTVWVGSRGDFDVIGTRHSNYPDPDYIMMTYWHSSSGDNKSAYSNPEVDKLLEEQRATTTDDEKRKQLLWSAQRILWKDLPTIPLFSGYNTTGWRPYVRNIRPEADLLAELWSFAHIWLNK